jgi:modification methylase
MINEIILGDVYDILKNVGDNSFDMGITSPPYNKKKNRKGVLVKDIDYSDIDDFLPEEEYQEQQINILNELYRTIKTGGSFFYNHKIRWESGVMIHPMEWLLKTDWVIKQEIIWDRSIAANIRGWRFWQVEERVYWLYKPINKKDYGTELLSKHALLSSVWRFRPEMNKLTANNHPAPFPIELPTRCIYSIFDNEKEKLIVDPYMGSGTSAVVSKLLGHNYFGIDISKKYIDESNNRINNITEKEIIDFNNEISLHIVNKTYKDRKEEKKNKIIQTPKL